MNQRKINTSLSSYEPAQILKIHWTLLSTGASSLAQLVALFADETEQLMINTSKQVMVFVFRTQK
jgi:hypothetical protein